MRTTEAVADRMARAADGLLGLLDDDQLAATTWPFPDDERLRWFYTPTDHGGLPLAAMTPAQQQAAHRLLATGLSVAGYVTAAAIMGLENVLDLMEDWSSGFDRERGRDPLLYYVAIFGDPGSDRWGWRFGGHHLSVHHTIVDGAVVSSTPCFFGANPADSPLLGPHLHRPLAGVEDLARELVRSFDAEQQQAAVLSAVAPADVVGGNRRVLRDGDRPLSLAAVWRQRFEGEMANAMNAAQARAEQTLGLADEHLAAVSFTRQPKGVPVGSLSPDQQQLLEAVIGCYLDRLPDEVADAQKAKVASDLDQLHVAWAGGLERGQPHYYRLQGGDMLIEYDNAQPGVNHIHSVWRDLSADFGRDTLAHHYTDGAGHHGP